MTITSLENLPHDIQEQYRTFENDWTLGVSDGDASKEILTSEQTYEVSNAKQTPIATVTIVMQRAIVSSTESKTTANIIFTQAIDKEPDCANKLRKCLAVSHPSMGNHIFDSITINEK